MKASPEEGKKKKKKAVDILAGSDGESSEDGGEDLSKIQINEAYARRLEHNKRREALHRYEELKKQGHDPGSSDGSSDDDDESSDEEAAAVASRHADIRMFETIRRVRHGDPGILDKDAKIYSSSSEDEADEEPKEGKVKKERPMYLKDVNARNLLEEGPEFAARTSSGGGKYDRIAYDEHQREGLKAFLKAEKEAFGEDVEEEGDLIREKAKSRGGNNEEDDKEAKQAEELLGVIFGKDEELDKDEKFLKDYFFERPYLESGKEERSLLDDIQEMSEDEDELDKQDQYEAVFNFRHEEAAASGVVVTDRVMGHSRVVEGSVRKKESSRKQQRKSKEKRMAQAKQEQAEKLKHLKNLKKKEIAEKLQRIWMIAGIEGDAACKLGADDLEEDFDPEEYDRKMREMFDDGYYEADDVDPGFGSGEEIDLDKPDFNKEDEVLGVPKGWSLDESEEGVSASASKRALQKKEKELANGKGEDEKTKKISLKDKVELEKEMEEYYKLDYEDSIGDLKTRFKYKQVKPNSFGLSTWEILQADDKDLNQYVSMKKLAPYWEKEWKVTHHQKLNKHLIIGGKKNDTKKVKTSKKSKSDECPTSSEPGKEMLTNEQETNVRTKTTRSNRRKRRTAELKLSFGRLEAYGKANPKRHKKH